MAYWLVKSEPETWSWQDHVKKGVEPWDGVRNHQASKFMKEMKVGDLAFFYHSGKERAIVGIVEVVREAYPDPSDETGRFVMVDLKAGRSLGCAVTLKEIKDDPRLQDMALVKQARLSVMPVAPVAWEIICEKGKGKAVTTHRLCSIHEIEEETSKEFMVPDDSEGQSVFAVKKDGVISVFANTCPHLGIPLNIQPDGFLDMEKNFVICSTHGALFKLDDGECVHGPCLGKNLTPISYEIIGEDLFVSKGL